MTDKQANRQTDKQTSRQTDKQTIRQTDKQTEGIEPFRLQKEKKKNWDRE
jgi:hypothetical protein